jgi:type 1 glutamine amidotransferase
VLATLDEQTYSPKIIRSFGSTASGRAAFYSALGHSASTYSEPLHLKELKGGIAWAAGLTGDGCPQ